MTWRSRQRPDLVEARKAMSEAAARQDKGAFASFLSDDITSIDSAGKLRNKVAAIEDMPPGSTQSSAEIHDYGSGAVVAIGYVEFWQTGILVRDDAQWKQAAEITTPMTGAASSTNR